MEVEAVTHALCWITSKDDSWITHAVILTDSMSLLRKLEWETKTLPVSTKPRTLHHQSTGRERHGHHTSVSWRWEAWTSHHRSTGGERRGHHAINEVEERGVDITPSVNWRREVWPSHHRSTGGERCGHHTIGQLEERGVAITPSVNWRWEPWTSHHWWSGGEGHRHHTIDWLEVRGMDITRSMKWRRGMWPSHHWSTGGERSGHYTISQLEVRGVDITTSVSWKRGAWKEAVLNNLPWKEERGPSSGRHVRMYSCVCRCVSCSCTYLCMCICVFQLGGFGIPFWAMGSLLISCAGLTSILLPSRPGIFHLPLLLAWVVVVLFIDLNEEFGWQKVKVLLHVHYSSHNLANRHDDKRCVLSWQMWFSWQKFCHDKNYPCGTSCQWYSVSGDSPVSCAGHG